MGPRTSFLYRYTSGVGTRYHRYWIPYQATDLRVRFSCSSLASSRLSVSLMIFTAFQPTRNLLLVYRGYNTPGLGKRQSTCSMSVESLSLYVLFSSASKKGLTSPPKSCEDSSAHLSPFSTASPFRDSGGAQSFLLSQQEVSVSRRNLDDAWEEAAPVPITIPVAKGSPTLLAPIELGLPPSPCLAHLDKGETPRAHAPVAILIPLFSAAGKRKRKPLGEEQEEEQEEGMIPAA
mmetsp:Transcript_8633/g.24677  ORF Transcript_8633/g.24677 Transcript_8633/m.24677 type:complete len:234 (-) Transcript_8633:90-791(-)